MTVSVGEVIRRGRDWAGGTMSLRQLADKAGVSASQLSRIEGGKVENFSVETLGRIARGLDRDPRLLLIISGHIQGEEARLILKEKLRPGTELIEEWDWRGKDIERWKAMLDDPKTSEMPIRDLAAEIFQVWVEESLWFEGYVLPLMAQSKDRDLLELVETFQLIRVSEAYERAQRILDYARDQLALARLEDPDSFGEKGEEQQ